MLRRCPEWFSRGGHITRIQRWAHFKSNQSYISDTYRDFEILLDGAVNIAMMMVMVMMTEIATGSIDDIDSIRFSSNGCIPGGSFAMSGQVDYLTIEYKESSQASSVASDSWTTLLGRSAITESTQDFSDFAYPPPPLYVS